jgi:hypothetical protein
MTRIGGQTTNMIVVKTFRCVMDVKQGNEVCHSMRQVETDSSTE